ncbi:MAG: peptidoglycan DD-metalloendopeptidase family protein [Alphaproteobacteria bacterium]|nr:peptidoglycan DD-metalloendopeptidase family protein [Alphaproteobacteria bacterium]
MSEFKNLRKKVRRRRIETLLLAGYAIAVTCALFITLFNKNVEKETEPTEIADNYDYSGDILMPAFVDSAENNPFEQVYTNVLNIKLISDNPQMVQKFVLVQNGEKEVIMLGTPRPKQQVQYGSMDGLYQKERRIVMVQSGDTFIGLLNKLGMDSKNATEAYNALRKVYDTRKLQVGQYFVVVGVFSVQTRDLETIDTLTIEPERGTKYILRTNEYDKYVTHVEQEKFARDTKVVKGTINGTVVNSLANAGVPSKFRGEIINIFSHALNFSRDLHKGDTFEIKYEVNKDSLGEVVKTGSLLYASFKNNRRTYKMYRYNNQFFDDKGQTKKTGLDKKPLSARNARISSLFGYRRHPILKTQKFHSGVDYAAPRGTAVYASGNGKVEMARYVNGYGNFIKIRHNSEYETAYGHLQRFASGIRPGVNVRKGQVIAYVGSTGRSTGPHLHFEIIRRGQRINPLKAAVATGNDLEGRQLADFRRTMNRIDGLKETISRSKPTLAEKPKLAESASQKMTIAQTPLLIQNAQKDLPEALQIFHDSDEIEITDDTKTENRVASAISKELEKTEEKSAEEVIDEPLQKDESEIKTAETDEKTEETLSQEQAEKVVEKIPEEEKSVVAYKGKMVYPPRTSVTRMRETHLVAKLKAEHKFVMPGKRRPTAANKRAKR